MKKQENNYAFVDGQNLYLSLKLQGWSIDYKKFRQYLRDKYNVKKAFYFIGKDKRQNSIYTSLKKADFEIVFKKLIKYKSNLSHLIEK